jgi:sialic acid synthase SpsE
MAEVKELLKMEEEINEIKLQIGYILSRFLDEEEISEEEKREIRAILKEVEEGDYISKEEFVKELLGES